MRVADMMQRKLVIIRDDSTVFEAIQLLADGHISGLPVVDGTGRLVGVLSATDVLETEAGEEGPRTLEQTLVSEIMTRRTITATPDTALREAAQQMLYAEVKRLFVEDQGKLVGVISQTDIVRAVANGGLPSLAPVRAAPGLKTSGQKGCRAGAQPTR